MSRYTVGMPPAGQSWRYIVSASGQRVGWAIPEGDGYWGAQIIGGRRLAQLSFSPEAVAAAWGEITGETE